MKKIIISENKRGLLFKNGKLIKMLEPGVYRINRSSEIEVLNIEKEIISQFCPLDVLCENKTAGKFIDTVEVRDREIVLHYVNGVFKRYIETPGKHAFWNINSVNGFKKIDISKPEVGENVPRILFKVLPEFMFKRIEVAEYQKARLYFDRKLVKILDAGTYYFWNTDVKVDVDYVDTRILSLNVSGQEIMTLDKVSLRVNFVCEYRIVDFIKIITDIDDYEELMHLTVQLALRDYIGKK